MILVTNDDTDRWRYRIFLTKIDRALYPFVVVRPEDQYSYENSGPFNIECWTCGRGLDLSIDEIKISGKKYKDV